MIRDSMTDATTTTIRVRNLSDVFARYGGSPGIWRWWYSGQLLANGGITPNCTDHPCYAYRDRWARLISNGAGKA